MTYMFVNFQSYYCICMTESSMSDIVFTIIVKYGGYFETIEETNRNKYYFDKQVTVKLDSEYANMLDLNEQRIFLGDLKIH